MRPSHPTYRLVEEIGRGLALFKDHPMLIIWGALDWCFTADFLKERQALIPGAAAETVSGLHRLGGVKADRPLAPFARRLVHKRPPACPRFARTPPQHT